MVNSGYADNIIEFNSMHPELQLHFFWDKPDVLEETKVTDTLSFQTLNDVIFLKYTSGCRAYACHCVSSKSVKYIII